MVFPFSAGELSMSQFLRSALCGLLLALIMPLAAAQEQKGPPPVPVVVAEAVERELAPITWIPGTVISRDDTRLAAEVEGRLVWVAEVGAVLAPGDPAARLDDALLRQELAEQEATVEREAARLKFFGQEVERLQRLAKKNNAAQSQLDQALSNRDVARSDRRGAEARVALIRDRIERSVVRAPFAGVVTERLAQVGEWLDRGGAVVRLVSTKHLEVRARIPGAALAYVATGSALDIRSGDTAATGTVHTLVPVGDDQSRLYELRLELKDSTWPAGQTLRVAVPSAAPRMVVAVPRDALVLRRSGTAIFRILDDGSAERVTVSTGIAADEFIEVHGGIRPGDKVVIRGGERLRPGQKVNAIPVGSAP